MLLVTYSMLYIVSGLPRSGTSMLMQMLKAGGLKIFTDNKRKPDQDNLKGYFEYEKVKDLKKDNSWVKTAEGCALKVVSPLLQYLPKKLKYKIIFIERNLDEILASQNKMLKNRQTQDHTSDQKLKQSFKRHLKNIKAWLDKQQNFEILYINYNKILNNPEKYISQIIKFLNLKVNPQKLTQVIDAESYRNKS